MPPADQMPQTFAAPLLGAGDPPPVTVLNEEGGAPLMLLCDHASNAVPGRLDRLGLPDEVLERHIAYDIGAAGVTRLLAGRFDAPAILSGFSRLVIDINRAVDDPTSMPVISDGVIVPGNRALPAAEIEAREAELFRPYHDAVAAHLDRRLGRGEVPAIVSIHSFTPAMRGFERPWHIGILWDRDPRMAVPLIEKLREDPRLVVGDNEPYTARNSHGETIDIHAVPRGLPHVLVEIRQDLIATPEGEAEWAERLAGPLAEICAEPALFSIEKF